VGIQETCKLQESTRARKVREVFAIMASVLQTPMQKRHHFLKILDPTKDSIMLITRAWEATQNKTLNFFDYKKKERQKAQN